MTKSDNANLLNDNRLGTGGAAQLKAQVVPAQPKTLQHLPKRPAVDLAFHNLTYRVKEGNRSNAKTILKGVSGRLRSGELTAIMGPSGAGKSTLLNILSGYKTSSIEGSVTMNGAERNLSAFRKLSAYIMQDNQLHGNLTVQEAMTVATNLKLSKKFTKPEKNSMIDDILLTLSLSEHRNTMTRNLSGGQKKRLSIALELVSNPPIMFFDEPTSGLDSSTCFQCIHLLKMLAAGGRTVICTIHQPSARLFEMFDQLYTLADGQCVYQGSTKQLVPFLSTLNLECPSYHNPASYVIEVSCGEHGDHTRKLVEAIDNGKRDIRSSADYAGLKARNDLVKVQNLKAILDKNDASNVSGSKYEDNLTLNNGLLNGMVNDIVKNTNTGTAVVSTNEKGDAMIDVEKTDNCTTALLSEEITSPERYPTSQFHQFWVVLKRTLLFSYRDWTLMYLRLFAHLLVGFLIGALYYDIGNDGAKVLSNLGFLFFNMLFLMYTSMTITILSFPLEMPVLLKENFNRWYSLKSYYLAISVADLPFQAIFCVIYVSIVYYFTSQPWELFRFSMFLSACLLISFVAQSVGLVVGAAMNVQNGVFLAPVMSVPFLLFSGFFVSFDAIPVYLRWITYLSYIRYGFEGTALATYGYEREKLRCFQTYCHFKSPITTLEELDMVNANFTLDIVALVVIFVVLRISAYLFLRWKLKTVR
ncbi:ATP-binding cassette sub-family G member 1 [Drosophila miranda]|uniref:ATP-binding cassette sub-family G member 1 n=1 Tax=Drosophila pseudoobscura pseudoobscura TaxID=46245 RepID=Q29NQ1_DROPS|nr:ATP-binding cassette sub-family G member 1 [Drosophila pseudoobscura]XP_017151696.1 ATP-binding cassette sub-family G member 1 [Drosophila miranda]XP_026844389.1 ATP-binding cassette sub-family G member 1 isoform X1 [Drosophila persimilis]XP_026844390.1 ATP-binding cassette sub-family G member 1 isoform X2 [Drosophila persimilis]